MVHQKESLRWEKKSAAIVVKSDHGQPGAQAVSSPAPSSNPAVGVCLSTHAAVNLFGLMLSLPFLIPTHRLPIPSFQSEWLALLLGVVGTAALLLRNSAQALRLPRIAVAPLALLAVVVVQFALGMFAYRATAFIFGMYLLWSALLAVAGASLVAELGFKVLVTRLAWFLLLGSVMNALFGLAQYTQIAQNFGGLVAEPQAVSAFGIYGNLAQQNHFATQMALGIACVSYLAVSRQLAKTAACVAFLLLLTSLILSASRSSFLYLVWIAGLAWALNPAGQALMRKRGGWRLLAVLLVGGLVLALLVWLVLALGSGVDAAPLARWRTLTEALGVRGYLWRHALFMFWQQPWLGAGFDAFAYQLVGQLHALKEVSQWGIDQYAHNLFLQLLAVSGLCGLLALLGPGLAYGRRQWRLSKALEQGGTVETTVNKLERMWVLAILGVLLIHSMLEQPLFFAYFLGLAALVLGLSDTLAWELALPAKLRGTRLSLALACALALALLVKTVIDYDTLENTFFSPSALETGDANKVEARRKIAHDLDKYSVFAPLVELADPAAFAPESAPTKDKIAFNRRIRRFAPTAETEFREAALLAADGRITEAMTQFDRAVYAYPVESKSYLQRFIALGEADSAAYGALATHAREFMLKLHGKDAFEFVPALK